MVQLLLLQQYYPVSSTQAASKPSESGMFNSAPKCKINVIRLTFRTKQALPQRQSETGKKTSYIHKHTVIERKLVRCEMNTKEEHLKSRVGYWSWH